MRNKRHHYYLIMAFAVFIFFRILPALQGSPVFSIDAWPLLSDSLGLMHNAHASFFPCVHQPSCYFATWPSLEILTAQLAVITGIPFFYIATAVTVASSTVEFLSILLVSYFFTCRYWPATLFLIADAPANLFYSGFKQEMYAMPLVVLSAAFVIKRMQTMNFKEAGLLAMVSLGVIFGHHYSTYVLMGAMAGAGFYMLLRPHFAVGKGFFIALFALLTLMTAYYISQFNYITAVSGYSISFVATLFSYDVVLAILALRVLNGRKRAVGFPWLVSLIAVAAILLIPLLSKFLYVPIETSLAAEVLFLLSILPAISLGISALAAKDKDRASVIVFWLIAPIALAMFAVFDGDPVLAYRGYVAATLPSALLFSIAAAWLLDSRQTIGRIRSFVVILLVIVALTSGIYANIQPIYAPRDVINGSTWFYPLTNIEEVNSIFIMLPVNASVYTDLPTLSYSYMLNHQTVQPAIPQQFASEEKNGLLLLQASDANEFYFTGSYASIRVNLTALANSNIVFRGDVYKLYL
jgi:hypothetical protein